jgi:hypothetical protein
MPPNRAQRRSAQQEIDRARLNQPPPGASEVVDLGQLAQQPELPPEWPVNTAAFVRSLSATGGWRAREVQLIQGQDGVMRPQPIMQRDQFLDAEQLVEEVAQRTAQLVIQVLMGSYEVQQGTISQEEFVERYMAPDTSETEATAAYEAAVKDVWSGDLEQESEPVHLVPLRDKVAEGLEPSFDPLGPEELTESDRLALGLEPA